MDRRAFAVAAPGHDGLGAQATEVFLSGGALERAVWSWCVHSRYSNHPWSIRSLA